MKQTATKKLLYSGASPMELVRYSVFSGKDGTVKGFYTELNVNSVELGTLTPAQYRVITDKSNQGMRLSACALRRVSSLLSEDRQGTAWISFYLPTRALVYSHFRKLLEGERKKGECDLSRIVVEVSSEILYEDAAQISETMTRLNREFGVRFMISEFGDEYCPILRLPHYPVDFVLLDSSVNSTVTLQALSSAVKTAKLSNKTVIARLNKPVTGLRPEETPDCYITAIPVIERRDS